MSINFLFRVDHSLQYVRSKIFPSKRRKVVDQEAISPVESPVKRKERSLSSLSVHGPRVSIQKCLTKRRTKASCLRSLSLVCSFCFNLKAVISQQHYVTTFGAKTYRLTLFYWAHLGSEHFFIHCMSGMLNEQSKRSFDPLFVWYLKCLCAFEVSCLIIQVVIEQHQHRLCKGSYKHRFS